MAFSPNGYDPNLVMLVDIEVARRLDALTWTQAAAPNTACWYVAHGEGAASGVETNGAALVPGTEYKTDDVPATRGTEWNQDTHEFVSKTGLTQNAYPNGCLGGGLLITDNTTAGVFEGYSVSTGALVRSSPAHGFSQMRGLCSDGTHFYATGILTAGSARVIAKYLISDFSLVATWTSTWPEIQSPWGLKISGGFLYTHCPTVDKFFKVNAATMVKDSEFAAPVYSPGNYYTIYDFDIDDAGTFVYVAAMNATFNLMLKLNLSDFTVAAASAQINAMADARLCYYADETEERIYFAHIAGGSYAGKIDPATLTEYYATNTAIGHQPWGVVADDNYLYVFFEDQGVDRFLKNDISSYEHAPSLAGCQGTAQSYFYDSAAGRLYVHITGGGSPTIANPYLLSFHVRRFATDVEEYDGHLYLPVLPADSIPSVSSSTGRFHENGTSLSFGTIKILNGDGRFDTLFDTYIWEAKRVTVRLGEKGKGDANYIVIFDGWTGDISWNDDYVEIGTEDLRTLVL